MGLLAWIYGLLVDIRNALYDLNVLKRERLKATVLSVGNLTSGGAGKTPFVIGLAERLRSYGKSVAVLSRGYGRRKNYGSVIVVSNGNGPKVEVEEAGDEPYLMAERLYGIPVLVGKNRVRTGKFAIEKFGCEVLILDDGFQYRKLERDLNILLLDSMNPYGNGKLLPSGILRESVKNLKRADVIVFTRVDKTADGDRRFVSFDRDMQIAKTIHSARELVNVETKEILSIEELRGKRVFLFSGIAIPSSFEDTVRIAGGVIAGSRHFRDHHFYSRREILEIFESAKMCSVWAILTTEKDAVRIPKILFEIPVFALRIDIFFLMGEEELLERIKRETEKR